MTLDFKLKKHIICTVNTFCTNFMFIPWLIYSIMIMPWLIYSKWLPNLWIWKDFFLNFFWLSQPLKNILYFYLDWIFERAGVQIDASISGSYQIWPASALLKFANLVTTTTSKYWLLLTINQSVKHGENHDVLSCKTRLSS